VTLITHVRRFFHISVRDILKDSQIYELLDHGEVLAAAFYLEYGGAAPDLRGLRSGRDHP
jgi:hypothetical protein